MSPWGHTIAPGGESLSYEGNQREPHHTQAPAGGEHHPLRVVPTWVELAVPEGQQVIGPDLESLMCRAKISHTGPGAGTKGWHLQIN